MTRKTPKKGQFPRDQSRRACAAFDRHSRDAPPPDGLFHATHDTATMSEDAPPADAPPAEGEAPAPKPKLGGLARFKKAVGGVKAANAFTPGGLSKLPKKDPSPTPSAAPSEAGDAAPKKNPLAKLKSAVTKISAANAFGKAAPNMAKKPPSAAPSRAGSVMGEPAPSIASLGGFKKAAGSKPPSRAVSVMGDENDDPGGMKKGAKSVKGSSRATTPAGKDGTVAGSAPHSPAKSVKSKAAEDLPEVKATAEGATRLRNGNPGMVIAHNVEYGDEVWASFEGRAIAVGRFKAGELHPSRVFNQPTLA